MHIFLLIPLLLCGYSFLCLPPENKDIKEVHTGLLTLESSLNLQSRCITDLNEFSVVQSSSNAIIYTDVMFARFKARSIS